MVRGMRGPRDGAADPTPEPRHFPPFSSRWLIHPFAVFATTLFTLYFCVWLFPGVAIDPGWSATTAAVLIAVLGAAVWPVVVRHGIGLILLTAGLLIFVLNAAFITLASAIVEGFSIESLRTALAVSLTLAVTTGIVGSVLGFDDPARQRARVVRALGTRSQITATDVPGILFIQIDGLGHEILLEAMASGHAPKIAAMLEFGSHQLTSWECDLSSQTGAMQAGIMFGDNSNMPAFRWYDKERRRIMASNSPGDAADIESSRNHDNPLLRGGVSRGNVFSGGAEDSLYTLSSLGSSLPSDNGMIPLFASPGALVRIVGMMIGDVIRERRAARRARRIGDLPLAIVMASTRCYERWSTSASPR